RSPFYSAHWGVVSPATELVINYFWLHWIYLGLIWGAIIVAAMTAWLRVLGVPSPAFCWMVWAILGQASGAYVGPTCWAVMLLAGRRAGILHDQDLAAGRGVERALEIRIGVVEHGARRAQPAVDREEALEDEPDLDEAVIVFGMMRARLEPQDAGIGRGRLFGA